MTLAERFPIAEPGWKQDVAQPVIIRNRSGSVSSRRPYPVSKNPRFIPPRSHENFTDIIGVGEGNDVYLDPAEDADVDSDEAKDRIKRIKSAGEGAEVLIAQDLEAIPPETTNKLRSIKVADGALLSATQLPEEIEVDSTGVSSTVEIGKGGIIGAVRGILEVLAQPEVGTGSITFLSCDGTEQLGFIGWENGMVLPDGGLGNQEILIPECGGSSGGTGWWGTVQWVDLSSSASITLTFQAGRLVSVWGGTGSGSDIPGTEASPGGLSAEF